MTASRVALMRRRRRRGELKDQGPSGRTRMLIALVLVLGIFLFAALATAGGGAMYAMGRYDEIAADVVPPEQLIAEYSRGGATILDRNGELLYEFVDELSGLRRPISLSDISMWLIDATIAVEDPTFYENNGLNMRGLIRAGVENFAPFLIGDGGELLEGSGGSSITQQLAKNIYIPRELRAERSVDRKIRETVIALELTQQYEKDQILEWYLNSISYGGIYTGIEAAANGYFDKPASELTLAEASLLAGIPQSPALYNPYSPANRDETTGQLSATSLAKARQAEVLELMVRRGVITQEQSTAAWEQDLQFRQSRFDIEAPHFIFSIIAPEITARFGERALYEQGLTVWTTLDLNLQKEAEVIIERNVTEFGEQANLYNGAFVAVNPRNAEILTYVGSRDYHRVDIEGRNDNALARNSPGSTLKPFTFIAAFMNGWGTGTTILDTPLEIVDFSTGSTFTPRNPGTGFQGPITAARALGNSLNITAIKAMIYAGVPQTIQLLQRVGYTTLDNPAGYGPALTTGGGEVSLFDSVIAFSVLANGGVMRGQDIVRTSSFDPGNRTLEPVSILRIADPEGRTIFEPEPPVEQRVVAEEYAYLTTSIMNDPANTAITYGVPGALALANGYPSAAKTGTSEPFENLRAIGETWTIGYTPELVAGTWAGNADNAPISGITSTTVSLRSWKEFMIYALDYLDLPATRFERPPGVVSREVCWPSGKLATDACPAINRYTSLYAQEVLPGNNPSDEERERMFDTWWQRIPIDTRTDLRATELTPASFVQEEVRLILPDDEIEKWDGFHAWAARSGITALLAPPEEVAAGDLPARIDTPAPDAILNGIVTIRGRAAAPELTSYRLEWGRGVSPTSWVRINSGTRSVNNGVLGLWDTLTVADGPYTLRVVVEVPGGIRRYEIPVTVDNGEEAPPEDLAPVVDITSPLASSVVEGELTISGTAASAELLQVRIEYGAGVTPSSWTVIESFNDFVFDGPLAIWDTTAVEDGPYVIRVVLVDGFYGETSTQRFIVVRNTELDED